MRHQKNVALTQRVLPSIRGLTGPFLPCRTSLTSCTSKDMQDALERVDIFLMHDLGRSIAPVKRSYIYASVCHSMRTPCDW